MSFFLCQSWGPGPVDCNFSFYWELHTAWGTSVTMCRSGCLWSPISCKSRMPIPFFFPDRDKRKSFWPFLEEVRGSRTPDVSFVLSNRGQRLAASLPWSWSQPAIGAGGPGAASDISSPVTSVSSAENHIRDLKLGAALTALVCV